MLLCFSTDRVSTRLSRAFTGVSSGFEGFELILVMTLKVDVKSTRAEVVEKAVRLTPSLGIGSVAPKRIGVLALALGCFWSVCRI